VQMTKKGGFAPLEADDGFLYYTKDSSIPGIWKVPNHGGTEAAVLDTSDAPEWSEWAVVPGGMYFVSSGAHPNQFWSFSTLPPREGLNLCPLTVRRRAWRYLPTENPFCTRSWDLDNQVIVV